MESHVRRADRPVTLQFPLPSQRTGHKIVEAPPTRGIALPAGEAGATHDTCGWDTVFAVPVKLLNQHVARAGTSPSEMSFTLAGALYDVTIHGRFGAWQIAAGGAGSIVHLRLPIQSGALHVAGKQIDVAGAALTLAVDLDHIAPQGHAGAGAVRLALEDAVAMPGRHDPSVISALAAVSGAYFNSPQGLAQVSAFFAGVVHLEALPADAAFRWLKPTHTAYAYHEGPSPGEATFGILAMVDYHHPGAGSRLGANAVPAQTHAGFSIAASLLLRKVVLPILPAALGASGSPRIDGGYFELASDGTEIESTRILPLAALRHEGGEAHPECTRMKIVLHGSHLAVYTLARVEIATGLDLYVERTAYYALHLSTDAQGAQRLDLTASLPAAGHAWTDVAAGVTVTEGTLDTIASKGQAVRRTLERATEAIAAGSAVALGEGVQAAKAQRIERALERGAGGSAPPSTALVKHATGGVGWGQGRGFKLTQARLNGAMQLIGDVFSND